MAEAPRSRQPIITISCKGPGVRIKINKKLCIGCEACVNHCPDVFLMWGMYMKADFEVPHPERYHNAVMEAAGLCPKRAISVD
jgi:ferredoxin